jgi:hypothetical protein
MASRGRTTNLERLVNDARKRADAIRRDGDITEEARARRLSELVEEVRPVVGEALDEIDAGYENDLEALHAKAEGPTKKTDPQEMLAYEMKRARIERSMVARWTLLGPPSQEEYAEILASGDDVSAEVYEDLAPTYTEKGGRAFLLDALREGQEQRRTPEQRRADDEANSLELERESAIVMGEFTDPKDPAAREKFVTNLLEGRGLRSVHRDEHGWVSPDEAAGLDAAEVA